MKGEEEREVVCASEGDAGGERHKMAAQQLSAGKLPGAQEWGAVLLVERRAPLARTRRQTARAAGKRSGEQQVTAEPFMITHPGETNSGWGNPYKLHIMTPTYTAYRGLRATRNLSCVRAALA
ncbi:hypothetical protein J6590_068451 [Homalodisca vitripennis]|nr:hypothetical protein J6590_068451 [Homalodisca vitripennis]